MKFQETFSEIRKSLISSKVASDSFWAVFGNAVSLGLLLLSGIIAARVIGKECYGQYGTIKSLMTSFASFAAFGFGYSSTKMISYNNLQTKGLANKILKLFAFISFVVFVLLIFISNPISIFLDKPELNTYFYYIAILMLLKATWTVLNGILAGYKQFKQIGIINIVSSCMMILLIYPLSNLFGLKGAVYDLMLYQGLNALLFYICIKKRERYMKSDCDESYLSIFKSTFPIALHEFSATISNVLFVLIILNFSTYGEYGIYAIALQWSAIINIIPSLLMNVTLSYLSNKTDVRSHNSFVKKMLFLNFGCAFVPFLCVLLLSNFIASLYGSSFNDSAIVIKVCVISGPFMSLILVFQSNLISEGRNWNLAFYKLIRDIVAVLLLYFALIHIQLSSALLAVIVDVLICAIYLLILFFDYNSRHRIAAYQDSCL